jgi:hypothetical protein
MNERTFEVPCTVEIEHSAESLHAHVNLQGVEAGPGDQVIVHGAPISVPYGERQIFQCRATVTRATALGRLRARIEGYLELTELYEVGFSDGRAS